MRGPFAVIFEDYFGIEHTFHAWANSADEAIRQAEAAFEYPMIVKDVFFDVNFELFSDGSTVSALRWLGKSRI